jgi:hypothetical protein
MKLMRATLRKLWRLTGTTSLAVSLAVVVALVGGVVSQAVAAPSGTTTATAILKGVSNTATAVTTLVNSGTGAALSLEAKSGNPALSLPAQTGTAPLAVNSETKVDHLNADKLDGLDSGAFLGANATATNATNADNANNLDHRDSTDFLAANGKAVDSSHADQADQADQATNATNAANADTLDNKDSNAFAAASTGTVYAAQGSNGSPISVGPEANQGGQVVVISKDVPAGSYVVMAKAVVLNGDGDGDAFGGCTLMTGGGTHIDHSQTDLAPNLKAGSQVDLATQGVVNEFFGGTLKLECGFGDGHDSAFTQSTDVKVFTRSITAIRVRSPIQ